MTVVDTSHINDGTRWDQRYPLVFVQRW